MLLTERGDARIVDLDLVGRARRRGERT